MIGERSEPSSSDQARQRGVGKRKQRGSGGFSISLRPFVRESEGDAESPFGEVKALHVVSQPEVSAREPHAGFRETDVIALGRQRQHGAKSVVGVLKPCPTGEFVWMNRLPELSDPFIGERPATVFVGSTYGENS